MLSQQLRAKDFATGVIEFFEPVGFLNLAAMRYCREHELTWPRMDYGRVVVDPVRGLRIAAAYLEAPVFDEGAIASYQAFRDETILQFRHLTSSPLAGGCGVTVEPVHSDPYRNAVAMAADIRQNRALRVYASGASGNPHPLLTDDENTMFRAVHDAFAHAASGRGFDHHGEEAAWLKHSFMYTPVARPALTTETRGQNSAMIFGHLSERFPEQKIALLPEAFAQTDNITLMPG